MVVSCQSFPVLSCGLLCLVHWLSVLSCFLLSCRVIVVFSFIGGVLSWGFVLSCLVDFVSSLVDVVVDVSRLEFFLDDYCLLAYSLSKAWFIHLLYWSQMKSMSILFRFSVFFTGINAEEMGLHEACKTETRFQSGEEMGLFPPLGSCTIFLHVTSKLENDSFQLFRSSISF
jgi:hypothetical protein